MKKETRKGTTQLHTHTHERKIELNKRQQQTKLFTTAVLHNQPLCHKDTTE